MANIAHGRLARAVTEAGGLGIIGIGHRDTAATIEREAARAGVRFGIGLLAWMLDEHPSLLDAAIAQRPYLISISFGSVRPYADRLHQAGILLATQVSTRAAAVAAQEAGADLIVAQGNEAGGHSGFVGTLPLLQMVLDSVRTPVAAAGGIASPAGVAAVLAAGAVAAWAGTAFLLCPEAETTLEARSRIVKADETSTIHTQVFDRVNRLGWPPEFPGRALRNRFAETWHGREAELLVQPAEMARFRQGAERKDYDITSIFAGQAVGMVSQSRTARETVEWLGDGAEHLLRDRFSELLG
jgi:nitronate monooxygenase